MRPIKKVSHDEGTSAFIWRNPIKDTAWLTSCPVPCGECERGLRDGDAAGEEALPDHVHGALAGAAARRGDLCSSVCVCVRMREEGR